MAGLLGGCITIKLWRVGLFHIGMCCGLMIAFGVMLTPLNEMSFMQGYELTSSPFAWFLTLWLVVGGWQWCCSILYSYCWAASSQSSFDSFLSLQQQQQAEACSSSSVCISSPSPFVLFLSLSHPSKLSLALSVMFVLFPYSSPHLSIFLHTCRG